MTVDIRRDRDIHAAEGGWFHAGWHFSFDQYRDPEQEGVGPLRVFNDDRLEPGAVWPMMRFMQFWFLPSDEGLKSSVQQRQYTREDRTNTLLQIMGPQGEDGLDLAQDSRVWVSSLSPGASVEREFASDRGGYLFVMDGALDLGGEKTRHPRRRQNLRCRAAADHRVDDAEIRRTPLTAPPNAAPPPEFPMWAASVWS